MILPIAPFFFFGSISRVIVFDPIDRRLDVIQCRCQKRKRKQDTSATKKTKLIDTTEESRKIVEKTQYEFRMTTRLGQNTTHRMQNTKCILAGAIDFFFDMYV